MRFAVDQRRSEFGRVAVRSRYSVLMNEQQDSPPITVLAALYDDNIYYAAVLPISEWGGF